MATKSNEEWITFLLILIDHTKDFKPDWEGFAQDTGQYKRGKFVRQAYDNLRKKYAAGQFVSNVNGDGKTTAGKNTIPKTPGARVTKAGINANKRKVNDGDAQGGVDDLDGEGSTKSAVSKKKRKTSSTITPSMKEEHDTNGENGVHYEGEGQDVYGGERFILDD